MPITINTPSQTELTKEEAQAETEKFIKMQLVTGYNALSVIRKNIRRQILENPRGLTTEEVREGIDWIEQLDLMDEKISEVLSMVEINN